ncbi:uncharacterized protein LOC142776992 [Rhipicephalus microplus]|uniref:uncharacterized protein LOC142776992 n=1 Tax=Rhipicephalus microplus TaxID=6941 RepID=UPI003F6CC5E3
MATAGCTRVRCGGSRTNRVQFNPAIDLEMLSYVRNVNLFRDHGEWTNIASKNEGFNKQAFQKLDSAGANLPAARKDRCKRSRCHPQERLFRREMLAKAHRP